MAERSSYSTVCRLQAHRHDHIGRIIVVGFLHQGTAVGIGENQTHLLGGHHAQYVEQVADVEADFQRTAVVVNSDLFFGFFLLRVIGLNFQQTGLQLHANTAVLLVRQDRGTTKGFTQALTIGYHQLVATAWQHTLVVGEFAVDQFRGEGELAGGGANMVLAENDTDAAVLLGEQARQFENTLARHDDLVAFNLLDGGVHGAHGQTVTVGGNGAEDTGLHFQQHAVEVIAHVLLGHGEAGALDQTAQFALHQAESQRTRTFFNGRKIIGGQGGQAEAAKPGLDQQLLLVDTDIDQGVRRQTLADVHQLARRDGDLAWLGGFFQGDAADQFDFQVGTGQRQLLAFDHQQHIGEHWQGLATFHDASDQLQRFQQGFALNCEMHGLVPCLVELRIRLSAYAANSYSPRGCPRRIP